MTNQFTQEEKAFILNLINQIHVKPTQTDALAVVTVVHSIVEKLSAEPKADAPPESQA